MKKIYLLIAVFTAFITTSKTMAQAGCSTLAITGSTPVTVNCGGSATLSATTSGTGDAIYWYDAATGGNKVGEGPSFTTPVLGGTTSYWATEVITNAGGGTLPTTYCVPTYNTGCTVGDEIDDFTLTDASGTKVIEHLATGCSTNAYSDYTNDPNLVANLKIGDTYDFIITNNTPNQWLKIWIDFNSNGSFADAGELLFTSTTSGSPSSPSTGSITIPTTAQGGVYVMRVMDAYNGAPTDSCTPGSSYGETHDYKVSLIQVICESTPRTPVTATVINGDKQVPSTSTPSVYTDTDDTANFGNSYSGAPGSNCGTTADYLGGNEVVYYYTAGASYALNIAMSGLSAGESGVFVYESCLDIGTTCFEGMTSTTATNYNFNIIVQSGEDYYIVVSSSAATSTVGYTITLTETASPCQNLAVTSTTGATIPCIGSGTLQATGSGIGNDIYWYDAATGGNLAGIGSSFQTPILTSTTSYWAAEVISTGTQSSGYGIVAGSGDQDYTNSGRGLVFDAFQQFTIVDVVMYNEGTSAVTTSVELRDSSGNVLENSGSVNLPAGNGEGNGPSTATTVALNFVVPVGTGYQLVTGTSVSGAGLLVQINPPSFPFPLGPGGSAGQITAGASTSSWYETFYNWSISTGSLTCESPRVQVTATISTAGDVTVTTPLPYNTSDDTANYGDPYEGAPGTGTPAVPQNYLNGNDVVYKFTAQNTELVDILLSNLTGFYAGVFVYDSCADLGTSYLAAAVAGASDTDFGIENFQVTAGEDYYIVLSSWLNPSYGYTLDIIPYSCSSLLAPTGDASQDFVAGDFVSDLIVATTETGATLHWYSATPPSAANEITSPTTTTLMDNTTYYVTQKFNGCESPALAVTAHQIDCSTLAITASTGATITCKGSVTLTATGSGTGDDIYWYNAATGGNPIALGPNFTTPVLTTTTSYYAVEVFTENISGSGGPLPQNYCIPTDLSSGCTGGDNIEDFTFSTTTGIKLIEHLGTGCSPANYGDFTTDATLTANISPGQTYNFESTNTYASNEYLSIWIDLNRNGSFADPGEMLFASPQSGGSITGSITIPPTAGGSTVMRVINKYGGSPVDPCNPGGSFGETHDYKVIISGMPICESSPRTEVIATVNQTGDITVNYTALPYVDTDNTNAYGNDFSGGPGTNCSGSDYLNGDDVVYQYTADPLNDDILDIELSAISNPNTGMYIYASCGDVGTNCLAGGTNENGLTINVEDYYINAGETIFIVVSSTSGSTNYTLTINGVDCANIQLPAMANTSPYFVAGDFLDNLGVNKNQYGTLTWYATPPPSTPIDPATTPIQNGTTYYVTQTILGCESAALAVTPVEFNCQDMKITAASGDTYICAPGGYVTLNAQGGGVGSKVYWYDAATGGNVVNIGPTFKTNVAQTTSFWAGEVFIDGVTPVSGNGLTTYTYGFGTSSTFYDRGVSFTATQNFNLVSVEVFSTGSGGNIDIGLLDASENVVKTASFILPPGTSSNPTSATLTLNFNIQPGQYYLTALAGHPDMMYEYNFSTNYYPLPLGTGGSAGEITGGYLGYATYDYYYYYLYNWTITQDNVQCVSALTQITVNVNDQPTATPTTSLPTQKFCDGATLTDIAVTGTNLQWYSEPTGGNLLSPTTLLADGATYYATQTVNACESDGRVAVNVFVSPIAVKPTGNINQPFYKGQTIADLVVQGANLTWYEKKDGTMEITSPTTFVLENYETYYVGQSPQGFCESELLGITVHELLGADDPLFEALRYYPNPVRHNLVITNNEPIESIKLFNLLGQKVLQQRIGDRKASVDVSHLQTGTYFLWVTIDGKTGAFKLIKE